MPEQTQTAIMAKPVMHTLTVEQYRKLEALCQRPDVSPSSTGFDAAFKLGEQSVLQKLRNGFVTGL